MAEYKTDIAVIGAGAAGLAAARRLQERGADFLVVEARDRFGGRAHTLQTRDGLYPVELGAEFVHGTPEPTFTLMREMGCAPLPAEGSFFRLREGRLEEAPELWETMQNLFARRTPGGPDESVDDFLLALTRVGEPAEHVEWVRTLIEGFDAAITSDASILAIAKEWLSGVNDNAWRPEQGGYAALMRHLAGFAGDRILLRAQVHRVSWEPGHVTLRATRDGEPMQIDARRAVVTLPAGVLHGGRVTFDPALPVATQRALDAIAMGPAMRVVLEFRDTFWDRIDGGRYRDAGFFQAPECAVRTVWTQLPKRVPLLTAWAGGGAAVRFAELGLDPVSAALETCRSLFPSVNVEAELIEAHFHDWQSDPFACGAYSYVRVNGGNAREALGVPVARALYFAGEATSSDDPGTVAGALDTGYRAAEQALS